MVQARSFYPNSDAVLEGMFLMAMWTEDELDTIGEAAEIQIVTYREDGSPRKPVPIWVVRVGNDLFIRSVRGRFGGWYQGARENTDGDIIVDGTAHDVTFEPADSGLTATIDDAYHTKYHAKSPTHVAPIVAPSAAETTLRLVPKQGRE
ncbi:MAG TPA: DUF2255 family protein [Thermomicrobiales bacterium]|nr:DUF2255 family protein [Thermomicrobiales bacterium]